MKFAFVFFAVLFAGCQPGEPGANSCGVQDPINELPWLRKKVDTLETDKGQRSVSLVSYKQQTYIVISKVWSSSPASDIYNCDGQPAIKGLNVSYNQFVDNAKTVKVLYSKE